MSQTQRNKIVAYSFAFYSKMSYNEIAKIQNGGLNTEHKRLIGENHYNTLRNFCSSQIEEQRKLLERNEQEIVEAHIEALFT